MEFESTVGISKAIADAIVACWNQYRTPMMADADGILYYDRNPMTCEIMSIYLGNETISLRDDVFSGVFKHFSKFLEIIVSKGT